MAPRKKVRIYYDCEFIEDGTTIDLISIGMVDEDGNELYLISSEFNSRKASKWVRDNVLVHLPPKDEVPRYTRQEIRKHVKKFVGKRVPEFWAYYSAYDHIVLAQLFGSMPCLPPHWPHLSMDIKQLAIIMDIKRLPKKGTVVHDALADAQWNKRAYDFIQKKLEERDSTI